MKRKLVSLLCITAMMAAMLSGCGNSPAQASKPEEEASGAEESRETEESAESEPETSSEGEADGAGELEYVELSWYAYTDCRDVDLIQAALDEYFLEKLNCKVNVSFTKIGEWPDYISPKLQSGEEMDIVSLRSTPYLSYSKMGAFYPLDTLWDEYGKNVKGLFSEGVWDSLVVDGHIYMVPTLKDNAYIMGYVYNDTLASELGLDLENTGWSSLADGEDMLMEALALRDEKHPEYQGMPLIGMNTPDWPWYYAFERLINDSSLAACNIPGKEACPDKGADQVYNFYESDQFREFCLMKQRWVEAGILAYDDAVYESPLVSEPSTLLSGGWGYTWIGDHIYSSDFVSKLVVFDNVWTDSNNFTTAGLAIGANSKNPERAMMVIDLLNSDPYVATLLRFGVEGEHWERDAQGKMQLANRNADTANPGWIDWYGIGYGNLTIIDGPESHIGPDGIMLKKMAEYNDEAILAPHMGFVLDTEPIANEISACANVEREYAYLLQGQTESPEAVNKAVDELIAKLKENGSDKIVAEVQTQLDEWIANK